MSFCVCVYVRVGGRFSNDQFDMMMMMMKRFLLSAEILADLMKLDVFEVSRSKAVTILIEEIKIRSVILIIGQYCLTISK